MANRLIIHGTVEECVKQISQYVLLGITDPINISVAHDRRSKIAREIDQRLF
ncbi:MAG: hypothetical protein M3P20_02010 [Thermoproteota archaeon]|nr:hypothetical protein [Thermoproteota archaeon]